MNQVGERHWDLSEALGPGVGQGPIACGQAYLAWGRQAWLFPHGVLVNGPGGNWSFQKLVNIPLEGDHVLAVGDLSSSQKSSGPRTWLVERGMRREV